MKRKVLSAIITIAILIATMFSSIDTNAANGTWRYSGGGWWYEYADGSYAHSEYVEGYWLDSAGWYDPAWNGSWKHNSTGWWFQSGSWYPTSQWLKIDGSWYYFKSSGYMASNEWVGNYYLKSSGAMAVNEWIGEYYVDNNGAWVPGKTKEKTPTQPTTQKTTEQKTTEQKTTEQKTTEQKTTEQKTTEQQNNNNNNNQNNNNNNQNTTHTHKWVTTTTWTVFVPSFNNIYESVSDDGHGGHTYTTKIDCPTCGKRYDSYADFKANDKCWLFTTTKESTKNYYLNLAGADEYTKTDYYKCQCGATFDTYDNMIAHRSQDNCGGSWSINSKETLVTTHYPEIVSTTTTTTCSECGATK